MSSKGQHRGDPIVDVSPQYNTYKDTGCEVSPKCTLCPLVQCKYEDLAAYNREQAAVRHRRISEAVQAEGLTVVQVQQRFNVGKRTVWRALKEMR